MRRVYGMSICCLLLLTAPLSLAVAEETPFVLTVESAVELALQNNTDLKKESVSLNASLRKKNSVWNTFLPDVSLSAGISNAHGTAFDSGSVWDASVSAGVSISLNAGIPGKIEQILNSYASAQLTYEQAVSQLKTEVAKAFYALLAQEANIDISKNNYALVQEQYQKVQKNYRSGLASELSLLQAQYAVEEMKPTLRKLTSQYAYDMQSFLFVLGLDPDTSVKLEGSVNATPLSIPGGRELYDEYALNRFDLKQLQSAVDGAVINKKTVTVTTLAPSISLSERWSVSDLLEPSQLGAAGTFSVSLSIPVTGFIPGSSGNLSIKESEDAVTQAVINLESGKEAARLDITRKASEINRLWETISLNELNLGIAKRSYELSTQGYNSGLVDQTDLETVRQQLLSAEQSLLQARLDYLNSVYDLADALNISVAELYSAYPAAAGTAN